MDRRLLTILLIVWSQTCVPFYAMEKLCLYNVGRIIIITVKYGCFIRIHERLGDQI